MALFELAADIILPTSSFHGQQKRLYSHKESKE